MTNRILVIIVTYNAMSWLERCLGSVLSSSIQSDIIVIDNGSTDGTQNYIKEHFPTVVIKQSTENLGFGKANNIGLQYALDHDYDYVYLLNQDAWIMPDAFEKLIEVQLKNPRFGIISPLQFQANMQHLDVNFNVLCGRCTMLLDDLIADELQDIYEVPVVMAAHWLISKECLRKVGGFSPTFPHYGEDDNYANRAQYHGFSIGIVPQAKAVHDRENRTISEEHQIYREYIGYLIMFSEIFHPKSHQCVRMFGLCLKAIINKGHPFRRMKRVFEVLCSLKTIHRNKLNSLSPKAFLN